MSEEMSDVVDYGWGASDAPKSTYPWSDPDHDPTGDYVDPGTDPQGFYALIDAQRAWDQTHGKPYYAPPTATYTDKTSGVTSAGSWQGDSSGYNGPFQAPDPGSPTSVNYRIGMNPPGFWDKFLMAVSYAIVGSVLTAGVGSIYGAATGASAGGGAGAAGATLGGGGVTAPAVGGVSLGADGLTTVTVVGGGGLTGAAAGGAVAGGLAGATTGTETGAPQEMPEVTVTGNPPPPTPTTVNPLDPGVIGDVLAGGAAIGGLAGGSGGAPADNANPLDPNNSSNGADQTSNKPDTTSNVGGWLTKANDFLKTPIGQGVTSLAGNVIQGYSQGKQQEAEQQAVNERARYYDNQWRDPNQLAQLKAAVLDSPNVSSGYLDRARRVSDFMNSRQVAPLVPGDPNKVYGSYVRGT